MTEFQDRPNRFPLPPILLVATLAVAWALHWLIPIGWEADQVGGIMRGTGWLLVAVAIALDVWTFRTLSQNRTTVRPDRAASNLATNGPFAFSRNPIYLGNVMIVAGVGFIAGSRWFLIGAAVLFFLLLEFAIKREEKHLAANFPEEWKAYSSKVRRWL